MPVETHVDAARERVEAEREHILAERRAYEQFRSEVAAIGTTTPGGAGGPAGGVVSVADTGDPGASESRQLREAFAETVRPYSVEDVAGEEPLLETVREELGDGIALALAPGTDHGVTPQVKQAIAARTTERVAELRAMRAALDREESSLEVVADATTTVTDWLVEADETPLSSLGFEALQARHETLASHRDRCRELLAERQSHLHSCPGGAGSVTMRQRTVARFLYSDFPVEFPVLSTVTRLLDLLSDCQRAVRDHLVRRA